MSRYPIFFKWITVILWLSVVFVAARFIDNWRLSHQYSDLLPHAAHQVLSEQSALEIEVFALPNSAAAKLVNNFLKPLTEGLKNTQINYIDSSQNPELIKQYKIQKQGEMIIHKGEKSFQLSTLSYEAFFNGLKRLSQPIDSWVVFLDNLSSHSYSAQAGLVNNAGYSDWLKQLQAANYQAMVLPWQADLKLPKQVKLIVLSAPQAALNHSQITWLEAQLSQGMSVLWLTDPKYAIQQPALSLLFDVLNTDAFHQGQLIMKNYPEHIINSDFDRPMDLFEVMPFETASDILWVNDQQQVLAATQEINFNNLTGMTSRMMVVGDSDFLSNQYLNSGGNLEMSYRLIDWLLHNDNRVDLPTIGINNTQLHFSSQEILWFAGIMLILLPVLLLLGAGYYWRKSR